MSPSSILTSSPNQLAGESLFSESVEATTRRGIPIRNLWYMLLYVWNSYQQRGRFNADVVDAPSLDALLANVLAELIQQRMRIGLQQDYTPTCTMIPGIRGRIDFGLSLKNLSFQRGRAHCHYDIFCANVPSNQIIRSSLARVAKIGDFGPSGQSADALRSKIRRLVRNLEGIDLIELTSEQIQRQRMKRLDADYSLMLAICHLLQQRLMPTEDSGDNRLPGLDRDDVTLHQIFESFVATFYKIHLSQPWIVRSQKSISWKAEPPSVYLPGMSLDVYLQHHTTNRVVVIDTKFTANVLVQGRWDKAVFDRSHLFQMYSYLRSQEEESPSHRSAIGVLLYPACKAKLSESVLIQGHKIHWETIDLARPWQSIEADLLAIPGLGQSP